MAISGQSTLLEIAVSIPCKILGAKRSIEVHSHCNAVPGCATAMHTCNRCLGYWWLYIRGLLAFLCSPRERDATFYTLLFPISIALATGVTLLWILNWNIIKVHA